MRIFEQDRLASPGSLARVHATWESNCEACHHLHTPVNESRWSPMAWLGARAGETKCQSCHAGPPHHVAQVEGDTPACAACHRDHRGPESSLVRTEDETCTRCHENLLGTHRKTTAGSLAINASVTRFDHDRRHHPEFAAISRGPRSDPGHLKFSHAVHLASGFNPANGGKPLMNYSQLCESDRLRYGGKNDESRSRPVQLECAMCHRLDGAENRRNAEGSSRADIPARFPGATFCRSLTRTTARHATRCISTPRHLPSRFVTARLRERSLPSCGCFTRHRPRVMIPLCCAGLSLLARCQVSDRMPRPPGSTRPFGRRSTGL